MTQKLKPEDLMPEPVRPEAWECCGSDCGDACVWELYYRDKAAYDAQQRDLAQLQQTAKDVADEH